MANHKTTDSDLEEIIDLQLERIRKLGLALQAPELTLVEVAETVAEMQNEILRLASLGLVELSD